MKYILIADDEPLNQSVFEEMLLDSYEVSIVDTGQACLDSVQQRRPDLILMDIAMPEMDGITACKYIRENDQTRDIPVILVSAYASKSDRETGLAAGATDYVSKPFDITDLIERIEHILASRAA